MSETVKDIPAIGKHAQQQVQRYWDQCQAPKVLEVSQSQSLFRSPQSNLPEDCTNMGNCKLSTRLAGNLRQQTYFKCHKHSCYLPLISFCSYFKKRNVKYQTYNIYFVNCLIFLLIFRTGVWLFRFTVYHSCEILFLND